MALISKPGLWQMSEVFLAMLLAEQVRFMQSHRSSIIATLALDEAFTMH
jgi:hypothetical protein